MVSVIFGVQQFYHIVESEIANKTRRAFRCGCLMFSVLLIGCEIINCTMFSSHHVNRNLNDQISNLLILNKVNGWGAEQGSNRADFFWALKAGEKKFTSAVRQPVWSAYFYLFNQNKETRSKRADTKESGSPTSHAVRKERWPRWAETLLSFVAKWNDSTRSQLIKTEWVSALQQHTY